jgi:hypothetical protein
MGDSSTCDRFLGGQYLNLTWVLNDIDCFVSQSRGNESVTDVFLFPYYSYEFNGQQDSFWDKVGQVIGNLQALKRLRIYTHGRIFGPHHADEVVPIPDWEILARILSHMRQKIAVNITDVKAWDVEESRAFARAIRGHPTITSFEDGLGEGDNFPYEASDAVYSALATLPALESISIIINSGRQARPEDESAYTNPESLTKLLRIPSLRSVCFYHFYFTRALCQATATALMEGTAVNKLAFRECKFPAGECAAIMANAFSKNTSVSCIEVKCHRDQVLFDALATVLPLNSTLRDLDLRGPNLSPIFLALGKNTGLKSIKVLWIRSMDESMDESLSAAMKDGLGMNVTLESLELNHVPLTNDNSYLWCRALSFLRTNKALKSLKIDVKHGVAQSCVSTFCKHIAAMLQENTSLESLSIESCGTKGKVEDCVVLVTALQHHTTLKTLHLQHYSTIRLTDDEDKQMAALLKKNYAMESLPNIDLENEAGDVGAILRLNEAGRRYLVQDGSSVSKGVEVLSKVNDNSNCVFLHLLENPRLCDRSAVEKVSGDGKSNSSSSTPTAGSHGGKREPSSVHGSKESRRRLE